MLLRLRFLGFWRGLRAAKALSEECPRKEKAGEVSRFPSANFYRIIIRERER